MSDAVETTGAVAETLEVKSAKKVRIPKPESPFVVGAWTQAGFVPNAKQPETAITQLGDMVKWTEETFCEAPGVYEFIRQVKAKLTLVKVSVSKAKLS